MLVTVLLWPHAGDMGPELPGFVGAYGTAVAICDLLTATLLFSQFAQMRTATLLILSCGYLFTAIIVMIHLSSFPGRSLQSTSSAAIPTRHPGYGIFGIRFFRSPCCCPPWCVVPSAPIRNVP